MTPLLEKLTLGVGSLIIGIVFNHFWNKYVNKVSHLAFSIWHSYIGSSFEDVNYGSVKLSYNNSEVKNLYSSKIEIRNNSNKDIADLELNISCNDGSLILVSHGKNVNSIKELRFTDSYFRLLEKVSPDNALIIYTHRDYIVPVINRGDRVEINLLMTNTNAIKPILYVTCEHKGIKLKYFSDQPKLFGVPQKESVIIGLVIAIFLCLPIYFLIDNHIIILTLTFLNGLISSIYGVLSLKLNEKIKKVFY